MTMATDHLVVQDLSKCEIRDDGEVVCPDRVCICGRPLEFVPEDKPVTVTDPLTGTRYQSRTVVVTARHVRQN